MEGEIAAILTTFVRSIVEQSTSDSILNRVLVLRNAIVLRMDWHVLHCPITVSNHILTLLRQEMTGERRRMMAVVCDLVFSTLLGHNAYFTNFINFSEGPANTTTATAAFWRLPPQGPTPDESREEDSSSSSGGGGNHNNNNNIYY